MSNCFESINEAEGQTYKNLDCPHSTLASIEFYDCIFTGCSFTEAQFIGCKFSGCTFKDCDLSLISVQDTAFVDTHFEGCKVIGVNWIDANWHGFLNSIHFIGCTVNYSTFINLELKKFTLRNCTAHDVDFSEAKLVKADFKGTDFTDSRFNQTDLTEADFTGASHYTIDATMNTLKKTKFAMPEAVALLRSLDIILIEPDS